MGIGREGGELDQRTRGSRVSPEGVVVEAVRLGSSHRKPRVDGVDKADQTLLSPKSKIRTKFPSGPSPRQYPSLISSSFLCNVCAKGLNKVMVGRTIVTIHLHQAGSLKACRCLPTTIMFTPEQALVVQLPAE